MVSKSYKLKKNNSDKMPEVSLELDSLCIKFYKELKETTIYINDSNFDFTPPDLTAVRVYGANPLINYLIYVLRVASVKLVADISIIEVNSKKIKWYSAYNIYRALMRASGNNIQLKDLVFFMSMLEFDSPRSIWLKKLTYFLKNISINDLFSISEFHSYSDPVNRHILFGRNDLFAKNKLNLAEFNQESERVVSLLIRETAIKTKLVFRNGINKICFVVSRPFPVGSQIENNSHWIVAKYYLLLIDLLNKKSDDQSKISVYFIITGERSFVTPFSKMNPITDDVVNSNFDLLHSDIASLTSCYCGTEEKSNYKPLFLQDAFNKLNEIDPDVVVFMGGTYDSKLFRYRTYLHYPVAVLSTTSSIDNEYGRPDNFCDAIRAVHETHVNAMIDFGIKIEKVTTFAKPEFNTLETSLNYDLWTWPDGKSIAVDFNFVMLTPLTGERILRWLESLSGDEFLMFCELFVIFPKLSWVIVGPKQLNIEKFLKKFPKVHKLYQSRRIVAIDFTDNLKGLINVTDFLFIPTLGGGTTINMAAAMKKPSVIPIGSDGQTLVNESAIYKDIKQLISIVSKLCADRQYYDYLADESSKLSNSRRDVDTISIQFKNFLLLAVKNHNKGIKK